MSLSNLCTMAYDDEEEHSCVKVLSSGTDFYALLMKREEILLQVHYSKKEHKIHLLEGKLADSLKSPSMSDAQKMERCSETLSQAIKHYDLATY